MYYTYILRCGDGTLYTGITTDPARRLSEHEGSPKGAKYTASHAPVCFEAIWQSGDRATASRLEYRIKTLTRSEKLSLIEKKSSLKEHFSEKLDCNAYTRIDPHEFT